MLLAFAVASALLAVKGGAPGQVIDCAMVEGSALLTALTRGLHAAGRWQDRAGANPIDSGSPWYDAYETADGKWVAIGAIEPQFRAVLLERLGLSGDDPDLRGTFAATFREHPRDHWCALLEGSDACFAPVLSLAEAPLHPHNTLRGTFANIGGVVQPMPAPRYSVTATGKPRPPSDDSDALLAELGYDGELIDALRSAGIVG
jgi:alpha-methylacyl-CoA racemase